MEQRILSVFGDEFFPKDGAGVSQTERQFAVDSIVEFFDRTRPTLVYIIPSKGTPALVTLICCIMKIPYIMVSPYPRYFNRVGVRDKICIKNTLDRAKSWILMDDKTPKTLKKGNALYEEAVDFVCKVSNAIIFFYSKNTSKEYRKFMDDICAKGHVDEELTWELVYDSRKQPIK